MVASEVESRRSANPEFGVTGNDTGMNDPVLGFSHRCNQVALVGIVPPAVPINLMEV